MKPLTRAAAAICGLFLAAGSCAGAFADPRVKYDDDGRCWIEVPRMKNFNLDIVVDGESLPKIKHAGKTYIEAPIDTDFSLKLSCPSGRYLAVCSVDGLSIMTGKDASAKDSGYIIDDGGVTVPGYRLDKDHVAHFRFGKRNDSYAARMGKPKNVGVIAAKFFAERGRAYYPLDYNDCRDRIGALPPTRLDSFVRKGYQDPTYGDEGRGGGYGPVPPGGLTTGHANLGSGVHNYYENGCRPWPSPGSVEHDLGSEFGSKTAFSTRSEDFQRGTEVASVILEYASREKLIAAGILPEHHRKVDEHPNPFPADTSYACPPPPGWREDR